MVSQSLLFTKYTSGPYGNWLTASLRFAFIGINFINDVMGCLPQKGHMDFGQVGFAPYTTKPCVHKISNLSPDEMFIVNVEILTRPPVFQKDPLEAPFHSLVKEQEGSRVYKLCLQPGESTLVSYRFFYVRVVLKGSLVQTTLPDNLSWSEELSIGDSEWKEPRVNMTIKNIGESAYEAYVCEYV